MYFSFKKIILCFGASIFLFAARSEAGIKDDIYFGASAIDSITHYDLIVKNSNTIARKKNDSDALGSVFLGYGYTFHRFYIAAEMNFYFPKRSIKIHRPGASLTPFTFVNRISVQDYLSGDVLLGYRPLDSLLVFLRAGGGFSKISLKQFENDFANTPSFHAAKKEATWRVGLGLNYGFTCHFGIGIDYVFTHYQDLRAFWPDFDLHFKEKTYSNNVSLSFLYSF